MLICHRPLILCLLAPMLVLYPLLASAGTGPGLPAWQVLEFEEKAFWATASSRLELTASPEDKTLWQFEAVSAVPGNSEQVTMQLDPASGRLQRRERVSHGKQDSRLKSYVYADKHLLRERREPRGQARSDAQNSDPSSWALASQTKLFYPENKDRLVVTSPYLLIVIASHLQQKGPGASREVLVHTDENFYRATLTCGTGIPVQANYTLADGTTVTDTRETLGVAIKVEPAGSLVDKDDFSLLGLSGDLLIFFDRQNDLPLQLRGVAPRIGEKAINLKSVRMRSATS